MSDYPPGTVAVATVRGIRSVRVFRRTTSWVTGTVVRGYLDHSNSEVADVRPLVVLDLGDSALEVVGRLRDLGLYGLATSIESQTRPPKPPEPTGLGAVVEDSEGVRWVRHRTSGGGGWFVDGIARTYDRIDAVRVLSEGVQP